MTSFPNDQSNPAGAIPVYVVAGGGAGATGAKFLNIATNTSQQVKTGAGTFFGLSINTGGSGTSVALYDGTDDTGVPLGIVDTSGGGAPVFPPFGVGFATGLFAVTSGGDTPANITIFYS